jgi:putative mRNA 3-end processing factor
MKHSMLLELTGVGLYCDAGDFYIDPWQPVERAVITHAHSDHARWGSDKYLVSESGENVLKLRLGNDINVQRVRYGERVHLNGVNVSLHPAGHILGSAQIRIEHKGEVWVVSGDYKIETDATCAPFEQLKCHTFVTESTFGLPVFKWRPQNEIFDDITTWWKTSQAEGKTSILFAYALGKAQRVIAGLDPIIGPILTHGAVENVNHCYTQAGISLPATRYVAAVENKTDFVGAMVVAPPMADSPAWIKKFPETSKAFASGWMQIRGHRRRRAVDRGFVLSDHTDWNGLIETIRGCGAETVWVTHGYSAELARFLQENGLDAEEIDTRFSGDTNDDGQ